MMVAVKRSLSVLLLLAATSAGAQTLGLPERLVDFRSPEGEALLLASHPHDTYFAITSAFETQKNQSYCGVASITMTLNAIGAPAPTTPEFKPYNVFTQDNVLNDATETILPRDVLLRRGMTLDQLGRLLSLHPVTAEVRHAAEGEVDTFRKTARDYLAAKHHFVIVNYLRRTLGQERGGHISPLAAYDEASDRFLVLDVARYKYPPTWVKTADLFDAMNTLDADNDNKTRGYVLVSDKVSATQ